MKAATLAKSFNAELKVVVGIEPSQFFQASAPHIPTRLGSELDPEHARLREDALAKAHEAVDEIKNTVKMPLDKVTTSVAEVHEGEPPGLILSQSMTFGADLIVVGSRGLSSLDKIILGSVSTTVVSKSTIDVLIVK